MRNVIYISKVAALVSGIFFAVDAMAVDGTITINGMITDNTCTIKVNNNSNNGTVTLPPVASSALSGTSSGGVTAGTTPFSIALSGCSGSALNNVRTFFEPGTYVDASGRLNIASGGAGNVQVQLLNNAGDPIKAGFTLPEQGDIPTPFTGSDPDASATMKYFAQYYSTDATVSPGTVTTQVDYSIVYQ